MKKTIIAILIGCVCMAFLFGGCRANKPAIFQNDPVCGGVTDRTDWSAPKQIRSEDLVSLTMHFFCYDDLDESRSDEYRFSLERNDAGVLMLSVDGAISAGVPVSDEVLQGAQAIIKEQKLAEWNGVDRTTAGLPPEYGPCNLKAEYASGETIQFRKNGDPQGAWVKAFETYFLKVLAEAGISEAAIPVEALTIERFSMSFNVENIAYSYGEILCEDGVERFFEEKYDLEKQEDISEKYIDLDVSVYEGLQKVIENCGLDSVGGTPISFSVDWTQDGYAAIYVDYVNGRQIYAEYPDGNLPEGWPQMRQALLDYFAEFFA